MSSGSTKLAATQVYKGLVGTCLFLTSAVVMVSAGVVPAVLAAVALSGALLGAMKMADNADKTDDSARVIRNKIDTEVRNIATAHPQEAVKSPRFLQQLKQRFNLASASEAEVDQLRLALAPASSPQPRPGA